jgi:hypothetical protein
MAIKKPNTGHGKNKCGKYKCKGGCGKGDKVSYLKSASTPVSNYIALQKIANSNQHYRTFITRSHKDGKQDVVVEVYQPNGKPKYETFKGVSTLPSGLKHRIFLNEQGELENSGGGLLKGVTEIIRQQNRAATKNSSNIDEQFEKQALRNDPHLTEEQKWAVYEDVLTYVKKGDKMGAIDCCSRVYPGFSVYMSNKDEAVRKLAEIKHRDEPSRRIVMEAVGLINKMVGATENENSRIE